MQFVEHAVVLLDRQNTGNRLPILSHQDRLTIRFPKSPRWIFTELARRHFNGTMTE